MLSQAEDEGTLDIVDSFLDGGLEVFRHETANVLSVVSPYENDSCALHTAFLMESPASKAVSAASVN